MKSVFRKNVPQKKTFSVLQTRKKNNSVIKMSLDIFTFQCFQNTHLVKFCLFFIMLLHFSMQLNSLGGKYDALLPDICFSNFLKITFPAQFPPFTVLQTLNNSVIRLSLDIFTIQCLQITHLAKFCFFFLLLHFLLHNKTHLWENMVQCYLS